MRGRRVSLVRERGGAAWRGVQNDRPLPLISLHPRRQCAIANGVRHTAQRFTPAGARYSCIGTASGATAAAVGATAAAPAIIA